MKMVKSYNIWRPWWYHQSSWIRRKHL